MGDGRDVSRWAGIDWERSVRPHVSRPHVSLARKAQGLAMGLVPLRTGPTARAAGDVIKRSFHYPARSFFVGDLAGWDGAPHWRKKPQVCHKQRGSPALRLLGCGLPHYVFSAPCGTSMGDFKYPWLIP